MTGGYGVAAAIGFLLNPHAEAATAAAQRRTFLGKNLSFGISALASLAGCITSLSVLLSQQAFDVQLPWSLPVGGIGFHCDALGAFFLGVISLLGAIVSVYSIGYSSDYIGKRNLGLLAFLYNGFLLTMVCVVLADNVVFFLIVWEAMSIATYFLITYEHEDESARRAGFLYMVMTQIGTAFLVVMFLLLFSGTNSYSFAAFAGAAASLPDSTKTAIFLCGLIGFGIKAGILPFHTWLPEAHPAAPSNISALMSGVMIKTGMYGMIRVFFGFLGAHPPSWWGILVLAIGALSGVFGILYALMERDLKRMLAFSSIENIGIILLGTGAALTFSSFGHTSLAALALTAALLHVLNHATFKGLLFLGAGSIVHATGTKNIEELGGLIKKLPWTSLFFLVGAVAISALPPLNGFASEWLTFQALLLSFNIPDLAVRIAVPLSVALLALTGALAAACFVKAYGITFLGHPRTARADHAHEIPVSMRTAMAFLAVLCILFGIVPGFVLTIITPVASLLCGSTAPGLLNIAHGAIMLPQPNAPGISPSFLAGTIVLLLIVPAFIGFVLGGRQKKRAAMTWACGLEVLTPRMQYTATGFSKPLRMIFSNIYRARHEIEVSEESSPYFKPAIRHELVTESVFDKYLYVPANLSLLKTADFVRKIQTGHIQTYLAYIFIALILLLLFAR